MQAWNAFIFNEVNVTLSTERSFRVHECVIELLLFRCAESAAPSQGSKNFKMAEGGDEIRLGFQKFRINDFLDFDSDADLSYSDDEDDYSDGDDYVSIGLISMRKCGYGPI